MLAGASVIPFGALAAPREPVTSAVVLTHAVQAAARAVLPRETFFLTCSSCPAESASAAAIHVVTDTAVLTGTCQEAVGAILSLGTHLLTAGSHLARRTGTLASPWVALTLTACTELGAVLPESIFRASFTTVGSNETRRAITSSRHGVAVASIHAFTGFLAV